MTDFGTMSVTRSLSISTRNPSTSSGVSHFQSSFGSFYGALPLKDHDISSVAYPVGFYGNHGSEYFTSQSSGNGCGLPTSSPTVTCHQQQEQQQLHHHHHHHHHHHQQQQQQRARSEWITFSKPFLLKLVEKLCQLSFESESVSQSSSPEVSGGQGRVELTNRTPTISDGIISVAANDFTSNSTTTTTTASNHSDNSGSRKSRLKSRPVKFVRPFESSEERQKNEDSDCGNINVESDHETINNNINNATSPSSPNQPLQCNNNNKNHEKNKETLKRERDIGDDSDTEHVNVEDDDDDDGVMATNRMNLEKSVIDTPSISLNKSIFNPIANSSSSQIFNPIWSEYLKMNYNLTSTYQSVFNAHKGSPNQEQLNRQSWAAFNKSLVYKMFDDVLDTDKTQNQNPIYQTSQPSLHNARFLFANGGSSNHIGLHFPNGLDKHIGVYEGAYCGERTGSRSNREVEKDSKRSSLTQSRHKRLRDGFVRARHQLINRRNNRTKNSNISLKSSTQEIREEKKESNSICDVPILGALLRSNDNKISSHKSSQLINIKSNKTCPDQQQQQQNSVPKTTANINNTEEISSEVTIKNGFKQNSGKVETWPKWVALDKCQVRSLVDSLVATMMGTNENFSSPSLPSTPPFKSRDESEMQVDYHNNDNNKENENNDDSNRSYDNSTGSCNDQSQHSPPQNFEVSEAESSASHGVDRDSETETNFSGDTQLEHSDLEECSRNADEMSDDGGSSSIKDGSEDTDGCSRMECHSTHHRCSIKWKSNMLKRMKAEEPEKES